MKEFDSSLTVVVAAAAVLNMAFVRYAYCCAENTTVLNAARARSSIIIEGYEPVCPYDYKYLSTHDGCGTDRVRRRSRDRQHRGRDHHREIISREQRETTTTATATQQQAAASPIVDLLFAAAQNTTSSSATWFASAACCFPAARFDISDGGDSTGFQIDDDTPPSPLLLRSTLNTMFGSKESCGGILDVVLNNTIFLPAVDVNNKYYSSLRSEIIIIIIKDRCSSFDRVQAYARFQAAAPHESNSNYTEPKPTTNYGGGLEEDRPAFCCCRRRRESRHEAVVAGGGNSSYSFSKGVVEGGGFRLLVYLTTPPALCDHLVEYSNISGIAAVGDGGLSSKTKHSGIIPSSSIPEEPLFLKQNRAHYEADNGADGPIVAGGDTVNAAADAMNAVGAADAAGAGPDNVAAGNVLSEADAAVAAVAAANDVTIDMAAIDVAMNKAADAERGAGADDLYFHIRNNIYDFFDIPSRVKSLTYDQKIAIVCSWIKDGNRIDVDPNVVIEEIKEIDSNVEVINYVARGNFKDVRINYFNPYAIPGEHPWKPDTKKLFVLHHSATAEMRIYSLFDPSDNIVYELDIEKGHIRVLDANIRVSSPTSTPANPKYFYIATLRRFNGPSVTSARSWRKDPVHRQTGGAFDGKAVSDAYNRWRLTLRTPWRASARARLEAAAQSAARNAGFFFDARTSPTHAGTATRTAIDAGAASPAACSKTGRRMMKWASRMLCATTKSYRKEGRQQDRCSR